MVIYNAERLRYKETCQHTPCPKALGANITETDNSKRKRYMALYEGDGYGNHRIDYDACVSSLVTATTKLQQLQNLFLTSLKCFTSLD